MKKYKKAEVLKCNKSDRNNTKELYAESEPILNNPDIAPMTPVNEPTFPYGSIRKDGKVSWSKAFSKVNKDISPVLSTKPALSLSNGVILAPIKAQNREELMAVNTTTSPGGIVHKRDISGIMPNNIPSLHCSICSIGPECPEYKEGYICAYDPRFRDADVNTLDDVVTQMASILQENILRLRRGRLHEDLVLGGQVNKEVTELTQVVMSQAKQLAEMQKSHRSTTVVGRSEGILSRLFSGVIKSPDITISSETPVVDAEVN